MVNDESKEPRKISPTRDVDPGAFAVRAIGDDPILSGFDFLENPHPIASWSTFNSRIAICMQIMIYNKIINLISYPKVIYYQPNPPYLLNNY